MADSPFFRHVRRVPHGSAVTAARESWTIEAERCRMAVESALPDASVELYFNLGPFGRHVRGSTSGPVLVHRAAWVVGPRNQPIHVVKETRNCDIVAIRLHPWMAECVLGARASELRGSMVDLDEFWGSDVDSIRNALHRSGDPVTRLAIVERAVAARARRGMTDDVRTAEQLCRDAERDAHMTVGAMAAAHGLTHRRVIEVFDRAVGLKPKAYQRVRRLRRVLRLAHETPRPTWTAIAHRCGYFDQSHLINDFRLLTGISPSDYESTRSSVGHGFVPHTLA
jgi:AraC-like DNA-binding protein